MPGIITCLMAGDFFKYWRQPKNRRSDGGGRRLLQASLYLAAAGCLTSLAAEDPGSGGVMTRLDKTCPGNACSIRILSPKGL